MKEEYNPYKATVESILEMFKMYDPDTTDKQDLLDNIYVKCKESVNYDKLYNKF